MHSPWVLRSAGRAAYTAVNMGFTTRSSRAMYRDRRRHFARNKAGYLCHFGAVVPVCRAAAVALHPVQRRCADQPKVANYGRLQLWQTSGAASACYLTPRRPQSAADNAKAKDHHRPDGRSGQAIARHCCPPPHASPAWRSAMVGMIVFQPAFPFRLVMSEAFFGNGWTSHTAKRPAGRNQRTFSIALKASGQA